MFEPQINADERRQRTIGFEFWLALDKVAILTSEGASARLGMAPLCLPASGAKLPSIAKDRLLTRAAL
jgi:hypothetical protein